MAKVAPEKNEDQNGQSAEKEQQVFQKSLDFGARSSQEVLAANGFHGRLSCKNLGVLDLTEDRVLSRTIGTCTIVLLFVLALSDALETLEPPEDDVLHPNAIRFSSLLVSVATLGLPFGRLSTLQVEDQKGKGLANVTVNATVVQLRVSRAPKNSLDCDEQRRSLIRGTLEELATAEACAFQLRGGSAVSNTSGNVTFDLQVASGPPGLYTVVFSAADNVTQQSTVTLASDVERLRVLTPLRALEIVEQGQPLPVQPQVLVEDEFGQPLANRTVVAFSYHTPYFFSQWLNRSGLRTERGVLTHHLRGQNQALLRNASAVSDSNGLAVFSGLAVEAASSKFLCAPSDSTL